MLPNPQDNQSQASGLGSREKHEVANTPSCKGKRGAGVRLFASLRPSVFALRVGRRLSGQGGHARHTESLRIHVGTGAISRHPNERKHLSGLPQRRFTPVLDPAARFQSCSSGSGKTGRISTVPFFAGGRRAEMAMASSRSLTSMM